MYEIIKEVITERSQDFYYIHCGLTPKQINQLITFTRAETDLINLDGDEDRFMSLEQYKTWEQKRRHIYAFTDNVDADGNLCGIFWAGQKQLPQRSDYTEFLDPKFYQHTYAFRLYGLARGKGLSHTILTTCMGDYVSNLTLPVGAWLEVSGLNSVALHMDQKMGYKIVSGLNSKGRLILARTYNNSVN